jgi:hypothetical protein
MAHDVRSRTALIIKALFCERHPGTAGKSQGGCDRCPGGGLGALVDKKLCRGSGHSLTRNCAGALLVPGWPVPQVSQVFPRQLSPVVIHEPQSYKTWYNLQGRSQPRRYTTPRAAVVQDVVQARVQGARSFTTTTIHHPRHCRIAA